MNSPGPILYQGPEHLYSIPTLQCWSKAQCCTSGLVMNLQEQLPPDTVAKQQFTALSVEELLLLHRNLQLPKHMGLYFHKLSFK